MDWKTQALLALGGVGLTLLAGKTFRSIVLWPFAKLAKWTSNKKDDIIVEIAENDLGVSDEIKKLTGDSDANK